MRTILPLLALAACSSENDLIAQGADPRVSSQPVLENPVQEDRVVQVVVPEVDILFVVDNSSSMGNEQNQLHSNFPMFMEHFLTAGLDYHIGMVSTDMQRVNHQGKLRTGFGYRYIDLDTEQPQAVFDAMTASLGVHVGSIESGRAAAYTALELIRDEPSNVDFLRPEADLHIIFVSDDEDQSGGNPVTKAEFIDWALNLKDAPASVQMHGIVTPQQNCGSGNVTGQAYLDYAAATYGVTYSICAQDWAPALDALGMQTAGLKREFFLSRVPVFEPELLLEVMVRTVDEVSGQELTLTFEACLAGEETETCEVVYYPGRNSIVFLYYVPDPLSEVVVRYPMAEAYTAGIGAGVTAGPAIRASLLLLAACTGPSPDTDPVDTDTGTVDTDVPDTDVPDPRGGNVVVLVSDDIGAERTGAYGAQAYPTFTPNLDALAAQGVRFTNAYASPTCSPTRASLLTGRLPTRTGIGRWLFAPNAGFDLDPAEVTLAEMLALADPPYASAAVGKWHVVSFLRDDFANHPLAQGFSRHRGSLSNPREAVQEGNFPRGYENWEKNTDGALAWSTTYMTTDTVDEALDAIDTMPEPWFLYLALNAAHEPWHVPPAALNTLGVQAGAPDADLYDADILAADAEIGRFLDSLDPAVRDDLTIVYLADNGTPCPVVRPPYDPTRCKGTVYEGGVRVPLIVTGPWVAVPGSTSDALVHVVDVFPTLADIAGVDVDGLVGTEGAAVGLPLGLDGFSLLPLLADPTDPGPRETVFTEGFFPNGDARWTERGRTIRSATHKLVRLDDPAGTTEAFFALEPGALDEGPDLIGTALSPGDQAALDGLRAEMDAMDAALTFGW